MDCDMCRAGCCEEQDCHCQCHDGPECECGCGRPMSMITVAHRAEVRRAVRGDWGGKT